VSAYVLTQARADVLAANTEKSPMHKRWTGETITPALITYVQAWLRVRFGIETSLVIERGAEGRNRVALRSLMDRGIHEAEVRTLNMIRRRDPQAPMERVLLCFERAP
jgi:hypothetical protein